MSVRLDQDITNLTANLAAKTGEETVKVTGKLALQILLIMAKKIEQTEENKKGIVTLKKLQKSGEELQVVKLNSEHLEKFNELAKKYRISFAAITQEDQSRIFVKTSNVAIASEIMKDILKEAKENKVKDVDVDKLNFKEISENKEFYRYTIDKIKLDKATTIGKILNLANIENNILVNDYDNRNEYAKVEFKIPNSKREEFKKEIDMLQQKEAKQLERIYNISKREKLKADKKKLDEVIDEAKGKVKSTNDNKERSHKKERVTHEER